MQTRAHKYLTALIVAVCLFIAGGAFSSCTVDRTNTTPEQAEELADIEAEEEAAQASGDPERIRNAERRREEFELRVVRERAGSVTALLSSVHPVAGALAPLIGAAVPLFFKPRRRAVVKGAKAALDTINIFSKDKLSLKQKGEALGRLTDSVLTYFGKHSSPEGEAAMQAEIAAEKRAKAERKARKSKSTEKPAAATAGGTGA